MRKTYLHLTDIFMTIKKIFRKKVKESLQYEVERHCSIDIVYSNLLEKIALKDKLTGLFY